MTQYDFGTVWVKFPLGRLCGTKQAVRLIPEQEMRAALQRHAIGDWGNLSDHDREANDADVEAGGRLLSKYQTSAGADFYIITEADRSTTTFLMADEY